jgi:tRNA (guanine37-N1)-methyltransferase|tara:strand:- start:60 stop:734 length:675 start_codon:yes stop_codon:yes gene_type:complete
MRIDIISAVPSLLISPFADSILKRAQDKGLVEVVVHDLRHYTTNKHKKIDDYAFGGGAGMVMTIQPIDACISKLKNQRDYDEVIYMTPDGEQLNQQICNKLSSITNMIILCGHYKGIDERVRKLFITREISIGDYVLSGGELGAAVLADSIIRLIPGVLNDETSALTDSFQDNLLSPPIYTRPADYNGEKVPEILTSGNERAIEEWRMEQAIERTKKRRPDLLD